MVARVQWQEAAKEDDNDLCVIGVFRGDEKYTFVFGTDDLEKLIHIVTEYAFDPELSFTLDDAARVTERARALVREDDD